MRNKIFITLLILALTHTGLISEATAKRYENNAITYTQPEVTRTIRHGISKLLSEIAKEQKYKPTPITKPILFPLYRLPTPQPTAAAPSMPNTELQRVAEKPVNIALSASFLGFGVAHGDHPSGTPPDPTGAAGLTQYVQWVNTFITVFDKKTGAVITGPIPGNQLWQGFGGACESVNRGDPIVLFDKFANRWVFSQFAFERDNNGKPKAPFHQCVAVSKTADAMGPYFLYDFTLEHFNDYGKLGIWPDGYYLSFNMFSFNPDKFIGPKACVLDRNKMLAGLTATMQCFQLTPKDAGGILPADNESATTAPPPATPNFFVGFNPTTTNSLRVWKFHTDWNQPKNSSLESVTIPIASFTPVCAQQPCISQAETFQKLDALSDRVMYRAAYRNFNDHAALLVNHTIQGPHNNAAIRWYELHITPDQNITVHQQGTFSPDNHSRWLGSMAMDKFGNIALGYSKSSANAFPAINITGRNADDPLGIMLGEQEIKAGAGAQKGIHRWGDYSTMVVDPSDDATFWYTNEYMSNTAGPASWSTYISSFKFSAPTVTAPTTTVTRSRIKPSQAYVNYSGIDLSQIDNFTVENLPDGTTIKLDAAHNRFVINNIKTRKAFTIVITIHTKNNSTFSNSVTIPPV